MTCYQISQGGETVALVMHIAMAREIVHCQPPGYYVVDEVRIDDPPAQRQPWRSRDLRSWGSATVVRRDRPPQRWKYRGIGLAFVTRKAWPSSSQA